MKKKLQITIDTYNQYAQAYEDKFLNNPLYQTSLEPFINLLPQKASLLDAGCGPGIHSLNIYKKRPDIRITGCDLSTEMLRLAKKNLPDGTFEIMDVRNISKLKGKFDGILAAMIFPYLKDYEINKVLAAMNKLLNPQGVIYVSLMEGDSYGFETTSFSPDNEIYLNYYPAQLIRSIIIKNGFEVISEIEQDYPEQDGSITKDLIYVAQKPSLNKA